jgi:hypothetical protein
VAYNSGDGAIIMTDGENGSQLIREVLRTIAHEYNWPDFQPKVHRIVKVDPARFDLLAGRYQLQPDFIIRFYRDGEHLMTQATGQPPSEIFPDSDRQYFLKEVDAELTFETDDDGKGTQLRLHQNGRDMLAKRLDDAANKP